jgi:16S rRNA (guanine527-N7)-methyltransferase
VKKIDILDKYFPGLEGQTRERFEALYDLYLFWNNQINVISRKDFDTLYERHVLHSLGIAKVIRFKPGTKVLDVGTGGGFPGVPLAIFFPEAHFHLVDSIGKKIKVVNEVAAALQLQNLTAEHKRAEEVKGQYDFVVSRAVTRFAEFYDWIKNKFRHVSFNDLPNGVLYLKGGDLTDEMKDFATRVRYFELQDYFEEEFFETKKVVYVPSSFS